MPVLLFSSLHYTSFWDQEKLEVGQIQNVTIIVVGEANLKSDENVSWVTQIITCAGAFKIRKKWKS